MQLTGPEIMRVMKIANPANPDNSPDIVIEPFDEKCLGSNSYDLHLDNVLKIYKSTLPDGMRPALEYGGGKKPRMRDWFETGRAYRRYLLRPWDYDPRNPKFLLNPFDKEKEILEVPIPESGLILSPGVGYLGSTVEWTATYNLFPYIDGKSSIGRNFIFVHHTAGRGDDGFRGTWTLEFALMYPTVVKPNMRIGQIYYDTCRGDRKPYNENPGSHYIDQCGATAAAALQIEKVKLSKQL
jgi:dCTP deaminase